MEKASDSVASGLAGRLPHVLFAYGTLKRGLTNHTRYLGEAVLSGHARFIGEGHTVDRLAMAVRPAQADVEHGPNARTNAPILMEIPQEEGGRAKAPGERVQGELYRIDDRCLEAIDILEGVRDGDKYFRKTLRVMPDSETLSQEVEAVAYLYPASAELLALPRLRSYTQTDHAAYQPKPLKRCISQLCIGSHQVFTQVPVPLEALAVRLMPGDDLLEELLHFCTGKKIAAGCILACVGSTGPRTVLRPASCKVLKQLAGPHEIVSLSGTVGAGGKHHLHLAVSDGECRVFGGHLVPGTLVRTTAEIIIGVMQGLHFTRPTDPRTGYDELSICEVESEFVDEDGVLRKRFLDEDNMRKRLRAAIGNGASLA